MPNLIKTEHWTFGSCRLDLPSVQRIAHTIKDIRGITTQSFVFGLDGSLKGKIEDELKLIRSKGWSITPWYKT